MIVFQYVTKKVVLKFC